MGFTDRFKEAAEAARARLTDPGINDSGAIHGIHAVDPHPHDLEVAKRAMSLGAPDPYSLITHDEVVALTGIPVGGPSLTYADDDLGVRFDAEDSRNRMWSFGIHAGHAADESTQFDPVSWYQWMVASRYADNVGIGDGAEFQSFFRNWSDRTIAADKSGHDDIGPGRRLALAAGHVSHSDLTIEALFQHRAPGRDRLTGRGQLLRRDRRGRCYGNRDVWITPDVPIRVVSIQDHQGLGIGLRQAAAGFS